MSSFRRLRSRLPPAEKAFYEFLWTYFRAHKAWPSTWYVYRHHREKPKLAKVLEGARYALHAENTSVHPRSFELQPIGILATAEGDTYQQWLFTFFVYLRDRFYGSDDSQIMINQAEVQAALKLTEPEAELLGKIMLGGFLGLHPNWQPNTPGWQLYMPYHLVEEFPRNGTLNREVSALLDRMLAQAKRSRKVLPAPLPLPGLEEILDPGASPDARGPRRYQVFVSSTFEDLKDERQQVVHSLLEMQCFPAGMELFPATSAEQWKLIKSIISESDYYVVIVAARYGTLIPGQKFSYTEREFDFARRVGIPILAFYHSAPGKIIGDKTERTQIGKERLERFKDKLRHNRLCKAWSNAHELGSAVKSSLQQAIKDSPRAGWIRAN